MQKNSLKSPVLPLWQSLAWIIASVFIITGPSYWGFKYYLQKKSRLRGDPQFFIRSIIQTGPQRQALNTECLAEILQLSVEDPPSSQTFDVKKARETLLSFPLFSACSVKVVKPDALFIDYTIRQPIAWLEDFENLVVDREGYPFPFSPFFSPKNLPCIYLGVGKDAERPIVQWNTSLSGRYFDLALHILQIVSEPAVKELFNVQRIDVSNAFAESYGKREIVLITEDTLLEKGGQYRLPRILRLSAKNYAQELGNYLQLRPQLIEQERAQLPPLDFQHSTVTIKEKMIDLRIDQLAFIEAL